MSAAEIIRRAQAEDVALSLDGDRLHLEAERPPSAALLAELKAHKVVVIEALKVASARPAWIDRPAPAQQQAVIVEQPNDEPQHIIRTAATASPEWLEVRDQYIGHLMACRACYAPTGRHCAVGAELRAIYDSTPWS
ncbi:hypothetical protein [Azotobacter salinestris]|uniref:hypothetical protein n=1 Tax=Azotobacter salinestris TaxID=69964 RepID=UPI001FCB2EAE|nr:hypothetical protein [Azotobacter salinestris]